MIILVFAALDGGGGAEGCEVPGIRASDATVASIDPESVETIVVLGSTDATTAFGTGHAAGVVVLFTRR